MKYLKSLTILIAGALLWSCSNPVYVQKDDTANLNNYRTYMWVDTKASEDDNSSRPAAYGDISVRNAVNAELSKRGWREVSENPDVLVSYDLLVERTAETQSDPVYTQGFHRVYYNPYRRRWSTIYYPSQFVGYQNYEVAVREGTVSITMTDAHTDRAVWQAWTTERLDQSRLTDSDINKSVKNIFKKFNEPV